MSEIEELRAEVERLRYVESDLAHARAAGAAYRSQRDAANSRTLHMWTQAHAAEVLLSRLREVLAGHPECGVHPDGDPITCGWKRAVYDLRAVLADS